MTKTATKQNEINGTLRQAVRAKVEEMTPPLRRVLALRAFDGKCSPRQAIKAKCQECVGYEDITERVGGCTSHRCPLWAYRPYQNKDEASLESS